MLPDSCTDCGKTTDVAWSPAFTASLCVSCRSTRTDAELAATRRANLEAAMTARKGKMLP